MTALAGRQVVVTRAPHQAMELAALLRHHGAVPVLYPCIDIAPPDDSTSLDAALREAALGGFDWLVLTSANTVDILAKRLRALGLAAPWPGLHVAAVGPATASAAAQHLGLHVDVIPEHYLAESIAATLGSIDGARILLPQSALADDSLVEQLASGGARVTRVTAYRNIPGSGGEDVPRLLAEGAIDALTFTSASTVVNFVQRLRAEGGSDYLLKLACAACIGPKTAATAHGYPFPAVLSAHEHTVEGLVTILEEHFSEPVQE